MAKTPPVPVPAGQKYCFGCSQPLPLSAFSRRPERADGRGAPCKACAKARRPRYRAMGKLYRETCQRLSARVQAAIPLPLVTHGALLSEIMP